MPKFEKGKSGNPGGRPKEALQFSELARKYSLESLRILVKALSSKNEKYRIVAANSILDRAYGKPAQEVTGMPAIHTHFTVILDGQPNNTNAKIFSGLKKMEVLEIQKL